VSDLIGYTTPGFKPFSYCKVTFKERSLSSVKWRRNNIPVLFRNKELLFRGTVRIIKKKLLVVIIVIFTWQAMKRDLLLSSKHVYLIGREKVKNKPYFDF